MTVRRWEGVDCTGMVNKTDSGSLYFPGHMCVVDIKSCCPESAFGLKGPFSQLLRVLPSGIPQLSALSGNFPWLIRNAWSMIMTPSQEKPPSKSGSCGNTNPTLHPNSGEFWSTLSASESPMGSQELLLGLYCDPVFLSTTLDSFLFLLMLIPRAF